MDKQQQPINVQAELSRPVDASIQIRIDSKKWLTQVFMFLIGCEFLLVFLDIFVNHHRWVSITALRRLVNITREVSIGTWFSSTQMILCGVVLYFISVTYKQGKYADGEKKQFYSWSAIAAFFIYMGIDDAIKLHERVGAIVKNLLNRTVDDGSSLPIFEMFPSYDWQLVLGPFFGAMGLFILFFLWRELKQAKLRLLLITALGLYVIAVGLDFVEGMTRPYGAIADFFGTHRIHIRHYSKALEEFLEMLGTSFFLLIFLNKLFERSKQWVIDVA